MKKTLLPIAGFPKNTSFVFEKAVEIPASTSGRNDEKRIKNAFTLFPLLGLILGLLLFMPTTAAAQTQRNAYVNESVTLTSTIPNHATAVQWWLSTNNGLSWSAISGAINISYTLTATTARDTYLYDAEYYYNGQWYLASNSYYRLIVNPLTEGSVAFPKVIIYHENFNSYASGQTAAGFTTVNGTDPSWLTDPRNDFETSTSVQASGGRFLRTARNSYAGSNRTLYFNNAVSTSGYENIRILWTHRQTFTSTTNLSLSYSTDGGTSWSEVTGWQTNTKLDAYWRLVNGGSYINLPAGAANAANLRLKWVIPNHPTNDNFYALDDITIIGTPTAGLSTFSWSSLASGTKPISSSAANPAAYTVDGITMKWTGPAYQVKVTKEGVYNDEYQAPAYTYTMMQENASATVGTTTILNLDKPVEDLTFTLIDIDRDVNQFRDKLVIKGYNGTTLVPLNKYKVVHTSYNETRLNNNIISGTAAGLEAPAASKEGNVTITFGSAVDRVEIEYYNEEPNIYYSNGKQGFGIHNLSWRKYVPNAPMPVELISFKATLENNAAQLAWSTAMEKDNDKFVIERSQDGKEFKAIGEVKGNGNSSTKLNYTFEDADLLPGTNYYRLRQLDFDGTESLSSVVTVAYNSERIPAKPDFAALYPTVASESVNIKLNVVSDKVVINVVDASGKLVKQLNESAAQTINLPVQQLRSGIYFVTITDGQQKQTLKFIKL